MTIGRPEVNAKMREASLRIATGPLPRTGGVRTHILDLVRFSRHHPVPFAESHFSPYHPIYGGWRTWLLMHPQFPSIDPFVRVRLASWARSLDILHTHGHPVWSDLYRAASTWRVKRIHTVHQLYEKGDAADEREWRRLSRLNENLIAYCRQADATIVVSAPLKELLEAEGCQPTEIPSGVDFGALDAADSAKAARVHGLPERFVLGVGHGGPGKNVQLAVQVARAIAPRPMVAVGWGLTDKALRELGIEPPPTMKCLGPLPRDDFLDVLSGATLFFLPSLRETQSLATVEAMGLGRPCVLPDLPALRNVAERGAVARLYVPGDLSSALTAIDQASEDPSLGQRAQASVRARFDWRILGPRVDRLYEALRKGWT